MLTVLCPECRCALKNVGDLLCCAECQKEYTSSHGIVNFLHGDESYNEGAFGDRQKSHWSSHARLRDRISKSALLSLLNRIRIRISLSGRRDRIFADYMKRGDESSMILDLGCGGGRHYFCDYGRVIGVDPEMELLYAADELYEKVYRCLGGKLPFPDESFDYVVSTDVIGHIRVEDKDPVFAEMYRVLKKGGKAIHMIETDATNKWFTFAHQNEDLFKAVFVDLPGHYGLEFPTQLQARFLKHGFKEIAFRKMAGSVHEIGFLSGAFGNEYAQKSRSMRFRVALDGVLAKNLLVREVLNVLKEPVARIVDGETSLDDTCGALVVYEK